MSTIELTDVDEEKARAERITDRFSPAEIGDYDREEVGELVEEVRPEILSLTSHHGLANVFGMAGLHPNPDVRYHMLGVAAEKPGRVFPRQFIISLTHDDQDYVAFEAIRLCGELELQESIDDLTPIVGWPSEGLREIGKPVGVGRATGIEALVDVFETDDPDELADLEAHYRETGHLPLERLSNPALSRPQRDLPDEETLRENAPEGMVFVPGGTRTIGAEASALPATNFADDDFTTPYETYVPPFYIDKYPVTNAEYDEFVADVGADGHEYCHPSEPDDKDHTRNTVHEDVGDDHPVVGIDFYDAYAYAQWAGKALPLEEEWEAAARGEDGSLFPWGEEFDPDRLNWAGRAYDTEFEDADEWTAVLAKDDAAITETKTTPVDAFPEGASDYGAVDMLGNAWEYTTTNFYSRHEMYPVFNHVSHTSHENLAENHDAYPVIRGGAWSSIPEMTTTVYRGKDLLTDRHNEIGFRCIKRVE